MIVGQIMIVNENAAFLLHHLHMSLKTQGNLSWLVVNARELQDIENKRSKSFDNHDTIYLPHKHPIENESEKGHQPLTSQDGHIMMLHPIGHHHPTD